MELCGKLFPLKYIDDGRTFYCPTNDGSGLQGDYSGPAAAWSWSNFAKSTAYPDGVAISAAVIFTAATMHTKTPIRKSAALRRWPE